MQLLSTASYSTTRAILLLLTIFWGSRSLAQPTQPVHAAPEKTLEFVENKGQWNSRVRYQAEVPGGRMYLESRGFIYAFVDPKALDEPQDHHAVANRVRAHAYSVTFDGGNPKPTFAPTEATADKRNYFRGSDASHWASGVQAFHRVRYENIYAGISAQLYENSSARLEYDFQLQPGANPAQIRLRYTGADQLRLEQGQLQIQTSVGTVTELAPRAWQQDGDTRVPVSCEYALKNNVVSFRLGKYNAKLPLVIDPTVVFSSFTGATGDNWGFTATYDQQGNMYSGGIIKELSFPVSPGAYDVSFNGIWDIAIIKYNTAATGTASRLYATYLGGDSTEAPHSLVVNSAGELVVLGSTSSINYPTTSGAYDASFNGGPKISNLNGLRYSRGSDLLISKLSADGSRLLASTFLGGTSTDGLVLLSAGALMHNYGDQFRGDIITDGSGNIYLASTTTSLDFPQASAAGIQSQNAGGFDAVVCKLSSDLKTLLWSTYLGGSAAEAAYSIQLDAQRDVYVSGGTTSTNFPTTAGSYRPQRPTKEPDGFVAHLRADGTRLEQATYLGTPAYDQAYFVQLDAAANVYVLGQTDGAYPITTGLYSAANGHQFIQKLDPTLSQGLYSTRFGSTNPNINSVLSPTAFLVDDCERIYVCGWGGTTNGTYAGGGTAGLPVTANAIQPTTDGSDFYLAQFTPGMQGLEYATFFGEQGGRAEHVDGGTSRFDKRGLVYQAVCGGCRGGFNAASSGFPTLPGASFSTSNNSSNCNNAAFKIDFGVRLADVGPNRFVCVSAAAITLGGSPAGGTWTGPGVSALPGGGYQFTPSAAVMGTSILTYSVASTGTCVSTRALRMTVTPELAPTFAPVPTECVARTTPLPLTASPAGGVFSGPGVSGNTFSPALAKAGTHTLTYSFSDSTRCGSVTRTVVVDPVRPVEAGPDITLCSYQLDALQLTGATPAGGTWSGPGVSATGLFTPPNTNNRGAVLTLTYSFSDNACSTADTRTIVLAPSPGTNVALNVPACTAAPQYTGLAPFTCTFEPILAGGSHLWSFGDGATSTLANPSHLYAKPGQYEVKLTARYADCVVVTQFAPVYVGDVFIPNIITPNNDPENLNEQFVPRFSCQPASLQIFNRWGSKLYETSSYRNDWRGENLPDGVYYYFLRDLEGRTAKGWVEIKR
ncbi:gliding motility-associated C-terminal domain-containing protein [Hymenobacter sp. BT635]|uniref:Gliding motility-associated C-terminal domain-containing protein n=1 Tax=Hymenobacter nitidus TaxID=2880929 RepID=A0ABS8A7F5_9BACT|nr:gliding motility-associated C-terminal domain-containing protein [Hymenobacter nitidus]MCB2376331.1 gliding motility-associated C-terminal domain-containing protein [Hymenobacter nitidus]